MDDRSPLPAADARRAGPPGWLMALWLVWAAAVLVASWLPMARRAPGWALGIGLGLMAVAVAAGVVTATLGPRFLARGRIGHWTALVLATAAVASGALPAWLGAAAVPLTAIGPGLLATRALVGAGASGWLVVAAGLATLPPLGLAAALLGLFSPWLFAVLGAASATLWWTWQSPTDARRLARSPLLPRLGREEGLLLGILWALMAVLAWQATVPDCCADAVWAHLPLAEAIAEGRYVALREVWWTLIPHAYHMLAAIAHGWGGTPAAKLLHLVFLILTTGLLVALGERLHGLQGGLTGGLLFLSLPLAMWTGTVGNTDLGATFFALAAVLALLEALRTGRLGWTALAGALVGTAAAVKGFPALLLAPFAFLLALRPRGRPPRRIAAGILLLIAGALATAGPWLLRSALLTGDPFFPTLAGAGGAPGDPGAWQPASLSRYGHPLTVANVVALPITLTLDAVPFGVPEGGMGVFPLLWLPILVARWRAIPGEGRYLLLIAAAYFAGVWPLAQYVRYLLPAWALLALAIGAAVRPIGGRGGPRPRVGTALVAVALVATLGHAMVAWLAFFPARASLDFLSGRLDERAFLRRTVAGFDMLDRLAEVVPRGAPVLAEGLYATVYAKRYLVLYGTVPSTLQPSLRALTGRTLARDEALALFRNHGLSYFVAPANSRHPLLDLGVTRPVLEHEGFVLHELGDHPPHARPPPGAAR